jgi:hypothetical protein
VSAGYAYLEPDGDFAEYDDYEPSDDEYEEMARQHAEFAENPQLEADAINEGAMRMGDSRYWVVAMGQVVVEGSSSHVRLQAQERALAARYARYVAIPRRVLRVRVCERSRSSRRATATVRGSPERPSDPEPERDLAQLALSRARATPVRLRGRPWLDIHVELEGPVRAHLCAESFEDAQRLTLDLERRAGRLVDELAIAIDELLIDAREQREGA